MKERRAKEQKSKRENYQPWLFGNITLDLFLFVLLTYKNFIHKLKVSDKKINKIHFFADQIFYNLQNHHTFHSAEGHCQFLFLTITLFLDIADKNKI